MGTSLEASGVRSSSPSSSLERSKRERDSDAFAFDPSRFEEAGIIPRVIVDIFKRIEEAKKQAGGGSAAAVEYTVGVCFLEIHNEDVKDLLHPETPSRQIAIREDFNGNILVTGVQVETVDSVSSLMSALMRGMHFRATAATNVNERSSRSHAIFSVLIEQSRASPLHQEGEDKGTKETGPAAGAGAGVAGDREHGENQSGCPSPLVVRRSGLGTSAAVAPHSRQHTSLSHSQSFADADGEVDGAVLRYRAAKFHLVDLAGSERAKRTGAAGARLKESVSINSGLLALGNVISALGKVSGGKGGKGVLGQSCVGDRERDRIHVPYRQSKLTRLLQDSLGGNSRTLMIACISPSEFSSEETVNTLKYANRARNIKNRPVVNRDPRAAKIVAMQDEIEALRSELLRYQNSMNLPVDRHRGGREGGRETSFSSDEAEGGEGGRERAEGDREEEGEGRRHRKDDKGVDLSVVEEYMQSVLKRETDLWSEKVRELEVTNEAIKTRISESEKRVVAASEAAASAREDYESLHSALQKAYKELQSLQQQQAASPPPSSPRQAVEGSGARRVSNGPLASVLSELGRALRPASQPDPLQGSATPIPVHRDRGRTSVSPSQARERAGDRGGSLSPLGGSVSSQKSRRGNGNPPVGGKKTVRLSFSSDRGVPGSSSSSSSDLNLVCPVPLSKFSSGHQKEKSGVHGEKKSVSPKASGGLGRGKSPDRAASNSPPMQGRTLGEGGGEGSTSMASLRKLQQRRDKEKGGEGSGVQQQEEREGGGMAAGGAGGVSSVSLQSARRDSLCLVRQYLESINRLESGQLEQAKQISRLQEMLAEARGSAIKAEEALAEREEQSSGLHDQLAQAVAELRTLRSERDALDAQLRLMRHEFAQQQQQSRKGGRGRSSGGASAKSGITSGGVRGEEAASSRAFSVPPASAASGSVGPGGGEAKGGVEREMGREEDRAVRQELQASVRRQAELEKTLQGFEVEARCKERLMSDLVKAELEWHKVRGYYETKLRRMEKQLAAEQKSVQSLLKENAEASEGECGASLKEKLEQIENLRQRQREYSRLLQDRERDDRRLRSLEQEVERVRRQQAIVERELEEEVQRATELRAHSRKSQRDGQTSGASRPVSIPVSEKGPRKVPPSSQETQPGSTAVAASVSPLPSRPSTCVRTDGKPTERREGPLPTGQRAPAESSRKETGASLLRARFSDTAELPSEKVTHKDEGPSPASKSTETAPTATSSFEPGFVSVDTHEKGPGKQAVQVEREQKIVEEAPQFHALPAEGLPSLSLQSGKEKSEEKGPGAPAKPLHSAVASDLAESARLPTCPSSQSKADSAEKPKKAAEKTGNQMKDPLSSLSLSAEEGEQKVTDSTPKSAELPKPPGQDVSTEKKPSLTSTDPASVQTVQPKTQTTASTDVPNARPWGSEKTHADPSHTTGEPQKGLIKSPSPAFQQCTKITEPAPSTPSRPPQKNPPTPFRTTCADPLTKSSRPSSKDSSEKGQHQLLSEGPNNRLPNVVLAFSPPGKMAEPPAQPDHPRDSLSLPDRPRQAAQPASVAALSPAPPLAEPPHCTRGPSAKHARQGNWSDARPHPDTLQKSPPSEKTTTTKPKTITPVNSARKQKAPPASLQLPSFGISARVTASTPVPNQKLPSEDPLPDSLSFLALLHSERSKEEISQRGDTQKELQAKYTRKNTEHNSLTNLPRLPSTTDGKEKPSRVLSVPSSSSLLPPNPPNASAPPSAKPSPPLHSSSSPRSPGLPVHHTQPQTQTRQSLPPPTTSANASLTKRRQPTADPQTSFPQSPATQQSPPTPSPRRARSPCTAKAKAKPDSCTLPKLPPSASSARAETETGPPVAREANGALKPSPHASDSAERGVGPQDGKTTAKRTIARSKSRALMVGGMGIVGSIGFIPPAPVQPVKVENVAQSSIGPN
uniref:Kinesin motor domain-containing protein n=1 Tax=Chromera velia CCMP2878 TaxID=1169474 RepID=A0A0G4IF29_9ALVE|eukprot:Cvel_2449.t1-p1 / transcript=Cvel_2449.t1 / gene=Cvel_2449 / organism=Chromera_velia_CCMP2878 / gene_product=Kinesin-like protein KIF21B, putative / transcript_product=Kinesin-like protein KIF21B, putative / location=Cvel_scaffold96:24445-33331(+) / protein_length=1924 / sequence_SO=supercontig / SO=protein_coding / is_pseudo=false